MDLAEFGKYSDYFSRCGLIHKDYPKQYLINVDDANGTVQSYYASKQTAIFRKSNDKDAEKRSIHDFPVQKFAYVCQHPEALNW